MEGDLSKILNVDVETNCASEISVKIRFTSNIRHSYGLC